MGAATTPGTVEDSYQIVHRGESIWVTLLGEDSVVVKDVRTLTDAGRDDHPVRYEWLCRKQEKNISMKASYFHITCGTIHDSSFLTKISEVGHSDSLIGSVVDLGHSPGCSVETLGDEHHGESVDSLAADTVRDHPVHPHIGGIQRSSSDLDILCNMNA